MSIFSQSKSKFGEISLQTIEQSMIAFHLKKILNEKFLVENAMSAYATSICTHMYEIFSENMSVCYFNILFHLNVLIVIIHNKLIMNTKNITDCEHTSSHVFALWSKMYLQNHNSFCFMLNFYKFYINPVQLQLSSCFTLT